MVLLLSIALVSLPLWASNVLGVHLGGVVQGAESPNITLSSMDWDLDNLGVDQLSTMKTTLTVTDLDTNDSMPVALALGVHGDIGKYTLVINGNQKTQVVTDMYGEQALDDLGVFYGSPTGVSYPLTLNFSENTNDIYVQGQLVFTAYYQS